ncbi:MAG TPA: cytochrome c oxidase subunit II [Solirubrobacteraceae bacterium]|nr:cytochrome c oxidase subunit II [Solirubrobacteraceae bacterium]
MPNTLHAYEHVQGIYLPIAVGVFALVVGTLVVLLVRGARRSRPGSRSQALVVEVSYACLLACVAGLLVWVTFTAETPIDRTVADPGLRLKVIAAQWSWRFIYPDGVSVADIDTWHPAPAYVPTGTEIEFAGTSEDVIHGFWIPALHYQRQFLPGYTTHFDLLFQKPGWYGGECSVLCGVNHSEMHFAVQAVSPQRFRAWLTEQHGHGDASS